MSRCGRPCVALRKESVDRNVRQKRIAVFWWVALRKESVDRNSIKLAFDVRITTVALRKESVDRNNDARHQTYQLNESLSARRAWIEIGMRHNVCRGFAVALRKESVDRNSCWLLA